MTPVSTATGRPGTPIRVGNEPCQLAVTPDGRTLFVVAFDGTITPVNVATGTPRAPIRVFRGPGAPDIAITPDSGTLFVA